jgi:hypothetical protein
VRNMIRIPMLLFIVALALSACSILQEPEEASGPIEAIPLEVATTAPAEEVEEAVEEPAEEPTAYPAADSEAAPSEAYPAAGESDEAAPSEAYPAPAAGPRIYVISQADSEVRFVLD